MLFLKKSGTFSEKDIEQETVCLVLCFESKEVKLNFELFRGL